LVVILTAIATLKTNLTLLYSFLSTRYNHTDFLFVAAAGNDGYEDTPNTVGSPSVNKNGISVGASQSSPPRIKPNQYGPNYLADFSSRGPTRDGRRKPDIVAPGVRILSANADPEIIGECDTTGTILKSGTSMAAPVVAGTAALVRQYFMSGRHGGSSFTPRSSLVKAVLLNSGQALVAVQNGRTGAITRTSKPYDIHQGFGRVDLSKTLPLDGNNSLNGIFINGKTVKNGDEDIYEVKIQRSTNECGPLSATLVWTDPAAAPNCNECVLNDLDLSVTVRGESGRFFPNGLTQSDTTNNAERVQINSIENGDIFTIRVKGTNLISDQEYSLAITGCFTESIDPTLDDSNDSDVEVEGVNTSDEVNCQDGIGIFNIGTGAYRPCSWLANNVGDYEYLCKFRDVAFKCPSACGTCLLRPEEQKKVGRTLLDGTNRWFGNHFDLEAKKDITIRSFDIHLNSEGSYQVQVFARAGQLGLNNDNNESFSWITICNELVVSKGYGVTTIIPESACTPFEQKKGQWTTFYVTTVHKNDLVTTRGIGNGTNLVDNDDIRVRSGTAVTYKNGASYNKFAFNGAIHYTLAPACRDATGLVFVDDTVGERTCSWLAENRARYNFVCEFLVSVSCPVTCGICNEIL